MSESSGNPNKFLSAFNPRKGTLNLKKNALRKFIEFLRSEFSLKKEIAITIKDLPRPEPQFLTIAEQDKLLQYVKGLGEVAPYYVMIKLMLFSGLRVGELINLKFSDVESSGLVKIKDRVRSLPDT